MDVDITPALRTVGMLQGVRLLHEHDPVYSTGPVRFTIRHRSGMTKAAAITPHDLLSLRGFERTPPHFARVKSGTIPGGHSAGSDPAAAQQLHEALLSALGHDPSTGQLRALLHLPGLSNHRVAAPMVNGAWDEDGQVYQDPHIPIVVPRHDAFEAGDILGSAFRQAAIGVEHSKYSRPNTLVITAHHRGHITPSEALKLGDTVTGSGTGFAPDITPGQSVSHHFLYPGTSPYAQNSSATDLSPAGVADLYERTHALEQALRSRHQIIDFSAHGAKTGLLAENAADKPVHPGAEEIAGIYDSIYGKRGK